MVVGSGFPERTDPAALVVGPTGVAVGGSGTLYVADSAATTYGPSRRGRPHDECRDRYPGLAGGNLNDPLGMAFAPNGDILTANGDNGNIVETTPGGMQLTQKLVDSNPMPGPQQGNGSLLALPSPVGRGCTSLTTTTTTSTC